MSSTRVVLSAWIVLLAAAVSPAGAIDRYEGFAYAHGSHGLVYSEIHWLYDQAGVPQQLVLYQCPEGEAFARAEIHGAPTTIAPDFDFIDGRDGHREGVRTRAGRREVYFQNTRKSLERAQPLPDEPTGVIDAGFDAFVRAHWSELSAGGSLEAPFLLPSRLAFVPFKICGGRKTLWNGRSVLLLRMGVDAWYSFAVPSIDLVYDWNDRQLLEYAGIGNIRDAHGRNENVRIEFPDRARSSHVAPDEVQPAANRPLTGRCGG